jgi:hypothetical protein
MAGDDPVGKIVEKAERNSDFSTEEIRALRQMADAWRGLEAFGRVAGVVKTILTWIGWAAALSLSWRAGLVDFIRGVASK